MPNQRRVARRQIAHQVDGDITGQIDALRRGGDNERSAGKGDDPADTGSGISGREATASIWRLAERQHGVVARRQLLSMGLSAALLDQRLRSGALVLVHRGVYAPGPRRHDLRERWMAAVLACGAGAVLSHASAAHLWGLRGSRGPVEVTRGSGGAAHSGIRLHQAPVPDEDVTVQAAIPVTSIERTLLDITGRLDGRQIERAIVEADRSGRLRWNELERVIAGGRGRRGIGRLREVARAVDPASRDVRSPLEVDFLALCREAELPAPQVNVLVRNHLVDFLWPVEKLVVELDSYTYHRDRPSFGRDHRTTVELRLAGYEVVRVAGDMLEDAPEQVTHLIRRELAARASI